MAVKIRLARHGAKKRPYYRVVVADGRMPRDGRYIEEVGRYNPLTTPKVIDINLEKVDEWVAKGAQPTNAVAHLIDIARTGEPVVEKKAKLSKKAAAKAAAAAEAERHAAHERAMSSGAPVMKSYALTQATRGKRRKGNCGVVVKGDADLLVHIAHCCNPVAGDEIVGFITRGRGVSVHRANCPNVADLRRNPERMIEVAWDTSGATEFRVEIVVEATDRMGLLKDITVAIGDAGANILSAATQTTSQGVARLRFLVAISDASLLDVLLAAVSRVPSVYDARRIMPGEGANQMKQRVK